MVGSGGTGCGGGEGKKQASAGTDLDVDAGGALVLPCALVHLCRLLQEQSARKVWAWCEKIRGTMSRKASPIASPVIQHQGAPGSLHYASNKPVHSALFPVLRALPFPP